ncbi:MAG: UbiA prenyltransferase family protein [Candidatus Aenigmatarchaeota archaeon]
MIKEYLKLSRLFNMGLTGVAPMLGALAMWNVSQTSLLRVAILFIIGCLSHIYGFVLNDVIDIDVDRLSNELKARPLVRGTITRKEATYFAVSAMVLSWLLALFFYEDLSGFMIILSILVFADFLSTVYNFISKKYPGMDIFVASAVFFLIIFGGATVSTDKLFSTPLLWIVAFIGSIQVLFMNMINGAIKDIDHDAEGQARTLAIQLGAEVDEERLIIPNAFKLVGYSIEGVRSALVFLPFLILSDQFPFLGWQIALLMILTFLTFYSIHKLFSQGRFVRDRVRKIIGIIVIFMYATTPVMMYSLHPYITAAALIPPLWFISSNFILHSSALEPKTM